MNKKASASNIIRKIFLIVFILIFLVCAVVLLNELWFKPQKNNKILSEAQELYNQTAENPLENLKEINPDVVGFITVPNTVINYPVVIPTEDEGSSYYLTHNYKKEYSSYGSIFVDSSCPEGLQSKNILLHGHNMNNGSMFAAILNYSDIDFYRETPTIQFDNSDWEVFAINKLNVDSSQGTIFDYLQCGFATDENFLNYINEVRERSLIDTSVKINEDDQIMLMSTCSYEYDNFRTVVYARRVRDGENSNIDTSTAKLNSNPLMPDIYYTNHNATKPVLNDFKTSLANGSISWYDGNKF